MENVRIDEVGHEHLELSSLCFVRVCAPLDACAHVAKVGTLGRWQRRGESGFAIYAQTPDVLREIGELLVQGAACLSAEPTGQEQVQ